VKMTPEMEARWQQCIVKAWSDDRFRRALIDDPNRVFAAEGIPLPEGISYVVVENEPNRVHLVLPARPSELLVERLDRSAMSDYDPGF
jgi:Nitrile hydratase, alpha chain